MDERGKLGDRERVLGRSLQPTSLVDQAYEDLYRRIADGVLAPGERLVIDRVAADFGTSIIPVREALARLLATRLVVFEANKGYRVAPKPTADQIRQIFETRLILETGAIDLGGASATPGVIDELDAINDEISRGRYGKTFEGLRKFVTLNERFHARLIALPGNETLRGSYEDIGYHQQTFRFNFGRGIPDLEQITAEHRTVVDALRRHDPVSARDALSRHIRGGYERLVSVGSVP